MKDRLENLPDSLPEILADPEAYSVDVARALIAKAQEFKGSNLRTAQKVAEGAVVLAAEAACSDTSIEALSLRGEIGRASADWPTAQGCYSLAAALLTESRVPKVDSRWIALDFRSAMLARDTRRFGEAERIARDALQRAQGNASAYWVRVGLAALGGIFAANNSPFEAAYYMARAYQLQGLGGAGFDRAVMQHLAILRIETGDLEEVTRLLAEADSTEGAASHAEFQAHKSWARGRLCTARGRYIPARAFLEDAAARMIELDRPAYAGSCLMDLAALHLEHERADRAAKLSAQLWGLFSRLKVDREAFAAAKLYTESAARDALTLAMVQQIKRTLELSAPNIPPRHAY